MTNAPIKYFSLRFISNTDSFIWGTNRWYYGQSRKLDFLTALEIFCVTKFVFDVVANEQKLYVFGRRRNSLLDFKEPNISHLSIHRLLSGVFLQHLKVSITWTEPSFSQFHKKSQDLSRWRKTYLVNNPNKVSHFCFYMASKRLSWCALMLIVYKNEFTLHKSYMLIYLDYLSIEKRIKLKKKPVSLMLHHTLFYAISYFVQHVADWAGRQN